MNSFEKYSKLRQDLTKYKDSLIEYGDKIATKKVLADLNKIIGEDWLCK